MIRILLLNRYSKKKVKDCIWQFIGVEINDVRCNRGGRLKGVYQSNGEGRIF